MLNLALRELVWIRHLNLTTIVFQDPDFLTGVRKLQNGKAHELTAIEKMVVDGLQCKPPGGSNSRRRFGKQIFQSSEGNEGGTTGGCDVVIIIIASVISSINNTTCNVRSNL